MVTGTPPAPGANVVLNPGFEAGNNGDWDVTGTLISANATPFFFPHAGRWFAFMQGTARTPTTR